MPSVHGRVARWITPGSAMFAISLAAAVLVFWSGLASLVNAWAIPEYSHGPIIPFISLFLFLREMRAVPPSEAPVTDRLPGALVVGLGLFVGIIGGLVNVDHIVTYGMMIWIAGLVLTTFGFRRGILFWPAVLHLVFMLPLPQFIYWQVSIYLQMVSSQVGVAVIAAMGIPVFLEGNIIDLGVYKLQVAEACSGLRYLFPMLSFSYVFAVLYRGPVWHKLLLLAAAAPITVLMNSFRIGVIGVLVNSYGISHAEGFLHAFEGWVIFVACVAILFLLAMILQRLTRNPKPLSETLDIEFAGLGDQLARVRDVVPSRTLAMVMGLTLATGLATSFIPQRAGVMVERDPFILFPTTIGDWSGQTQFIDRSIEAVLGADDYLTVNYFNPAEAAPVDLFIAFYNNQTAGKGIHSPDVCIPAGGWEVSAWETTDVTLPSGPTIAVNRAVIQRGLSRQLVYFWFEQRGRRMTGTFQAKGWTFWDSLTRNRTDGGLVRLITPIMTDESSADAQVRLEQMMDKVVQRLPRFIPE